MLSMVLNKRLKILEKFADIKNANSILDIEIGKISEHHQKGDIFRTELNLHTGRNHYRAVCEGSDSYSSIDEAVADLARQVGRDRKKRFAMIKKGGRKLKQMLRRGFRREK
ncbi:hypothetical protein CO179_01645 [candidate division WWE3 bacterium CG_4_9_14_3_um_filter_39_7]|uniref:Ribosomal subunit interface protein n=1 Tax=candidate division WWE3 bacterium CG_4_9_14_3_um_filter_39_7 TaxID=1975080 RepID=A0A2M7X3F8_UNCKA|nr:MAG: hypothetical protein CO179_01645 [candidate division WWE3 bacterium CG_4_9_14_3_um_filter_39_7]